MPPYCGSATVIEYMLYHSRGSTHRTSVVGHPGLLWGTPSVGTLEKILVTNTNEMHIFYSLDGSVSVRSMRYESAADSYVRTIRRSNMRYDPSRIDQCGQTYTHDPSAVQTTEQTIRRVRINGANMYEQSVAYNYVL